MSVVVAGVDNDIPLDHEVTVVGGTILIRGVTSEDERKALEAVVRVLVRFPESLTQSD